MGSRGEHDGEQGGILPCDDPGLLRAIFEEEPWVTEAGQVSPLEVRKEAP